MIRTTATGCVGFILLKDRSLDSNAKEPHPWAEQAKEKGVIQTKEGSTAYVAGDYLVYNDPTGKDGYAVKSTSFHSMYEPVKNVA
ncbi:MAG TPA: hypothetical protein VE178_10095 [Silvibacterium sp.]|nr:hypothetical protein [Silvibacterium sp.]